MTNQETIYNALGLIEGAVCVSQKNTREVIMKAVEMIKSVIENDIVEENDNNVKGESCEHSWELKETRFNPLNGMYDCKYECSKCGKVEIKMCE